MIALAALLFAAQASIAGAPATAVSPATPAPGAAATPLPPSGPVSVTAVASKTEVTVGEPFTVELAARGPQGTSYEFPPELAGEGFELRSAPAAEPKAGAVLPAGVHRYDAAVYALSQAEIPAIPVRYKLSDGTIGEARTAPLVLKVASLLPKNPEEQKLADIRGPLALSIGVAFWLAVAAAGVALGVLVFWLMQRRRKPSPPAAPAVALSPDVEARRELAALLGADLLARGEYRAFYIRLTAAAKRYLERRLGAPVLEMTTAETLAFLRGHPLADGLLSTVREVADAADRIKFAQGDGLQAEGARHLEAVGRLVDTLEARLAPPAAPATEKVA